MKRKISLVVALMLMALTVFGCGKIEELENTSSSSLSDIINDEEVAEKECPEGYVYDYQVSMEPIPEEIAALGGDVCGTIHAYPTKIQIALTKQEIDNDAELREQNEKNIEAINEYLSDIYGGEYEVEPLRMRYEYLCTERSTGKSFGIFVNPLFEMDEKQNVVLLDQYFYMENAEIYKQELNAELSEIMTEEYEFNAFYENGASLVNGVLDVYISIFKDKEVDYIEEQKQIIKIYKVIKDIKQNSADSFTIRVVITYIPSQYKDVIRMQYDSQCMDDFTYIINDRAEKLIQTGEIWAQFEYFEDVAGNDENSLDKIVENEEYNMEEKILPYWR